MNHPKARTVTLLVAASLAFTAPAWAQSTGATNEAVLRRIDALAQEIEQLKGQIKSSSAGAQGPGQPASAPQATATRRPPSEEGEADGVDVVKTARATLNFYGMMDVGLEALKSDFATANDKTVRVSNGIITPHFGVRGTGQMSKGLQGLFHLEGSFAPDNGTSGIGGRLFGRQAYVGLSGAFGRVTLGRQYTMVRVGWEDANPYGTGNQGLRLLDARISNPRADNSISYLGKWGPVSAGVNLSTGWDAVNGNSSNTGPANAAGANCAGEVPTDEERCHAGSVAVKYDSGNWGVAGSFERLWGGTTATFGGLTSSSLSDTRTVIGAYMFLPNRTKLAAGWINRENDGSTATPKSNMYWIQSFGIPLGNSFFIDALLGQLEFKNSPNKALLVNVRGRYVVSSDTTLYLAVSSINNSGTLALSATASTPAAAPRPGGEQTSVIAGIRYRF